MIIQDERIKGALGLHPELLLGLDSFAMTHDLESRPALIAQARPVDGSSLSPLNLDDAVTLERLKDSRASSKGYWAELRNGTQKPSFGGVSYVDGHVSPYWAFEARPDWHFIAGVFEFPELPEPKTEAPVHCMADFYAVFFTDFLDKVNRQFEEAAPALFAVTATLVNASALHFAGPGTFGDTYSVRKPPLAVTHLQWPARQAVVGLAGWTQLAVDMGRMLTGAYGQTLYQRRS